jgi:hypothetical protein
MNAVGPSDDPHAPLRMKSAFQISNQLAPSGKQTCFSNAEQWEDEQKQKKILRACKVVL